MSNSLKLCINCKHFKQDGCTYRLGTNPVTGKERSPRSALAFRESGLCGLGASYFEEKDKAFFAYNTEKACPLCHAISMSMIEYAWDHPCHYDGFSEWECQDCGARIGRWSGKTLKLGEYEAPKLRFQETT
jgi:hypothetical protein